MKKYTVTVGLFLLLFGMLLNGIWRVNTAEPVEPKRTARQHLLSFTGTGSTEGGAISLYIDGTTRQSHMGDQRIKITGEKTFRICVVRTSDGQVIALDIVGVNRDSKGRIQERFVERLPMSDLQGEHGVQFKTDPGLIAGIFIDDPLVFKLRVTKRQNGSEFTMHINYLQDYGEGIRNTLVLRALFRKGNWELVRYDPVEHKIKPNLHLINRSDVHGVLIKTQPVQHDASQ